MVCHGRPDSDNHSRRSHDRIWKPPQSWRRMNRVYWLLAGIHLRKKGARKLRRALLRIGGGHGDK